MPPPSKSLVVVLLLGVACVRPPRPTPSAAPKDRLVLVISIDGLPAYLFGDKRLSAPTLRRLAREGAIADGMEVINPSVTWPNHTTLSTGVRANRHGVLYNGRLLRGGPRAPVKVEQRDRADLVRVPTLYDVAAGAGLRTAQIDWIPHQVGGTITWAFPEVPRLEGIIERELIAGGLLAAADVSEFRGSNIAWRDEIWTGAASYIVARYRPNLVYFHLLNLDATHHRYGPRTVAGMGGVALADARIREILDAVEHAGLKGRTTIFVVSDHGFREVRHQIKANAALRVAGMVDPGPPVVCDVWVVPEGGTAMVYVTNPERRDELVLRAKEVLGAVEGVERVIEPAEFPALGYPLPQENDQMADLVLSAKPGYAFAGGHDGDPVMHLPEGVLLGTHGYLAADPEMNATFIAWGWGIRPGTRLGMIKNVDVAPTVGAVLGLGLPGAEGRVLKEILR